MVEFYLLASSHFPLRRKPKYKKSGFYKNRTHDFRTIIPVSTVFLEKGIAMQVQNSYKSLANNGWILLTRVLTLSATTEAKIQKVWVLQESNSRLPRHNTS